MPIVLALPAVFFVGSAVGAGFGSALGIATGAAVLRRQGLFSPGSVPPSQHRTKEAALVMA